MTGWLNSGNCLSTMNTLILAQYGCNFEDDIFKYTFVNEIRCVVTQMSLQFVSRGHLSLDLSLGVHKVSGNRLSAKRRQGFTLNNDALKWVRMWVSHACIRDVWHYCSKFLGINNFESIVNDRTALFKAACDISRGVVACQVEYVWWNDTPCTPHPPPHRMETFSALLALCEGNPPVTGGFPSQRPVTRSFDILFDMGLNKWLGKQSRRRWVETPCRSLWRHCNDVCQAGTPGYFKLMENNIGIFATTNLSCIYYE